MYKGLLVFSYLFYSIGTMSLLYFIKKAWYVIQMLNRGSRVIYYDDGTFSQITQGAIDYVSIIGAFSKLLLFILVMYAIGFISRKIYKKIENENEN